MENSKSVSRNQFNNIDVFVCEETADLYFINEVTGKEYFILKNN